MLNYFLLSAVSLAMTVRLHLDFCIGLEIQYIVSISEFRGAGR